MKKFFLVMFLSTAMSIFAERPRSTQVVTPEPTESEERYQLIEVIGRGEGTNALNPADAIPARPRVTSFDGAVAMYHNQLIAAAAQQNANQPVVAVVQQNANQQ